MSYLEFIDIKFLIILFIILLSNIIILKYRYEIAKNFKIIDFPNERKIHNKPTPLIGGISYFLSLLILLFYIYFTNQIKLEKIILLISIYSVFFLVGFFDDVKALSAKLRSILIIGSSILFIIFDPEFIIYSLNFKSYNSIYDLGYFSYFFHNFLYFFI